MAKKTLYEITDDIRVLSDLMESFEDENGDPREPTEEEMETLKSFFEENEEAFKKKFDSYCKFIKNLNLEADDATSEKENVDKEVKRLRKRATAFENRAKAVKDLLWFAMNRLKMKKYKTTLFTVGEQNTQFSVSLISTFDIEKLPSEYLAPKEVSKKAICDAVKDGLLTQKEGVENYGKLFDREGNVLEGVLYTQGKALVIR